MNDQATDVYLRQMFDCTQCAGDKALDGATMCREAYEKAHDVRKFEITLYWQRALYFWGFEAAFMVAFGTILASDDVGPGKYPVLALVSAFAIAFTWLWRLALIGSKRWQENWEAHIDLLEACFSGNLYKTVLCEEGRQFYSVSRTNEAINTLLLIMWLLALSLCFGVVCGLQFPIEQAGDWSWLGYSAQGLILLAALGLGLGLARRSLKTDFGRSGKTYRMISRSRPVVEEADRDRA